jgi:hypothetical protein
MSGRSPGGGTPSHTSGSYTPAIRTLTTAGLSEWKWPPTDSLSRVPAASRSGRSGGYGGVPASVSRCGGLQKIESSMARVPRSSSDSTAASREPSFHPPA